MFLSDLIDKEVYVGKHLRGVCVGVGISLKTAAVKYLLCGEAKQTAPHRPHVDFAVGVSALESVQDTVRLSKTRTLYPKNCAKFFPNAPVYSEEGIFLGCLRDLELHSFVASKLFTDRNEARSFTAVAAVSDAVILKKEAPYPLGQRIPAPVLSDFSLENPLVTKATLRSAAQKGGLIRLTLSLPPFSVYL